MKRVGKFLRAQKSLLTALAIGAAIIALFVVATHGATFEVLQTRGSIAHQQRELITFVTVLSLVVIVPVFIMVFVITHRYRADKPRGSYKPHARDNRKLEALWWGIPLLIIAVLSVVIYTSSHRLDPFRPIESDKTPLTIEVVSLQWKWLFIYPEQGIATVNYFQIPEDRPVYFKITADSPMNAFWIPQLGGQIYAMNGMQSELHLMADSPGTYNGRSSNISGEGFSKMAFKAESVSQQRFDDWVTGIKTDRHALTSGAYETLAAPSTEVLVKQYGSIESRLFGSIIMKFMGHGGSHAPTPAETDTTEKQEAVDHSQMNHEQHMQHMEGN